MQVADIVGKHPSRVKEWAKQFRMGGIDQLLKRGNGGGRKPKMSAEIQEAVIEKLRKGVFRTAGQCEQWLSKEHNVTFGKGSIYYALGKLGGRMKVPRPSHQKKDPEKVDIFRNTLAEEMLALNIPGDKKVVLWVYDEMRYGLHPLIRKMWSLVGHRVIAPVNRRFKWGYLCGAILTLPAYSPELNPIEKLWDIVKDGICNINGPDLAALEAHMTEILKTLWQREDGFRSLFLNSYLRTELNVLNNYDKPLLFC